MPRMYCSNCGFWHDEPEDCPRASADIDFSVIESRGRSFAMAGDSTLLKEITKLVALVKSRDRAIKNEQHRIMGVVRTVMDNSQQAQEICKYIEDGTNAQMIDDG